MRLGFALRPAVALLALLGFGGCPSDDETRLCDGGSMGGGSDIICSLSASPMLVSTDDGGATYLVTISAQIPHLIGNVQALVTVSDGTVAGAMSGIDATVWLTPAPEVGRGSVSGKVKWSLPRRDAARITARMEEASTSAVVNSP